MNINLKHSDEPRLTPPDVVYEHKASLKKKASVLPVYGTMTAAAAAAALLLLLAWPHSNRPALEMTAALKPLAAKWAVPGTGSIILHDGQDLTLDRNALESLPQGSSSADPLDVNEPRHPVTRQAPPQYTRQELPLLASLPPVTTGQAWDEMSGAQAMTTDAATAAIVVLPQSSLAEEALAWTPEGSIYDSEAELLMERGFFRFADGDYEGLGSLLLQGWRSVKVEIAQLNESVGESFRLLKQMPTPPSLHSDF